MRWYRAQDTFTADLSDHTTVRVAKGDPFPDSHELVQRDAEHIAAAKKAGTDRAPLFKLMDSGEDEPAEPKAPPRRTLKGTL